MFGIGYQEMFVLLVAALVIFGPGRLPEMAGQIGRWVRDFRRMTADLTGEFEKTMAEVEDVKRSVRREMRSMTDEVDSVSKSVKKDLAKSASGPGTASKPGAVKKGTVKPIGAGTAAAGTKSGRIAKPAAGTAVLPVATKTDPLADVSFLDDEPPASSNGRAATTDAAAASVRPDTPSNGADQPGANGLGAPTFGTDDEALARVRYRRSRAGYNRRS